MPSFVTDDKVRIHYEVFPETPHAVSALPPLFLQHGFTGSSVYDFVDNGLIDQLVAAGRTIVALDARGHGASDKPHLVGSYGNQRMARDVVQLADQLGVSQYDLLGFSMGGFIALWVATFDHRLRRLALTGVGGSIPKLGGPDLGEINLIEMAEWLESPGADSSSDPRVMEYIGYADSRGLDRQAVAACARGLAERNSYRLAEIKIPVLLLNGDDDPLAADGGALAQALPNCRYVVVKGDHGTALDNPDFAATLLEFTGER